MTRTKLEDHSQEYQKGYRAGYQKGLTDRKKKETGVTDISKLQVVGSAYWMGIGYDGYADGYPVIDEWQCSNCGREVSCEESDLDPYCGSCGYKMNIWKGEDYEECDCLDCCKESICQRPEYAAGIQCKAVQG